MLVAECHGLKRTDEVVVPRESTVAEQHKDFEAAIAELKTQLQKVSAQLELSKPATQAVLNNH